MQEHKPTYEEALALFKEFNQSESLLKHAYSGFRLRALSRAALQQITRGIRGTRLAGRIHKGSSISWVGYLQ